MKKKYLIIEAPDNVTAQDVNALGAGKGEQTVQNFLREWESHFGSLPTAFKVIEADTFPAGKVIATLPTKILANA